MLKLNETKPALAAVTLSVLLAGCENIGGDVSGGEADSTAGLVNDGTAVTAVTADGNRIAGNFICSHSISATDPQMVVGSNGLVGGVLTDLLDGLSLDVVGDLLNSVQRPEQAADGSLDTAAGVTLTAGLLGGVLTSVDLTGVIRDGGTVPGGYYAVAGISFPGGVANLSLFNSITVTTSLLGAIRETMTLDQSALSLLGIDGSSVASAWVGFRSALPYDAVTLSIVPGVLSVNVGNAMRVHEFCYDGRFVFPRAS